MSSGESSANQRLIENMQAVLAHGERQHAETVAYYRGEVERLRASLEHVRIYAEENAAKYEEAADGTYMSAYFRGKADAFSGMALKVTAAYVGDYREVT